MLTFLLGCIVVATSLPEVVQSDVVMTRIAIISDIHAYDSKTYNADNAPSHFDVSADMTGFHCPIDSLLTLIEQSMPRLAADFLFCPGDLANRGCSTSLPVVWRRVQEVASALRAGQVVATSGNHDVDSRFVNTSYDPIEALKNLVPSFPVSDPNLCLHYWAEHYFLLDIGETRLVVLNSSAYHSNCIEEVDHGRIAERTLRKLQGQLRASPDKRLNVLLCHHNPHVHSEFGLGEEDQIKGGQLLLDLIDAPDRGNWLVVHGHKHHPKLSYASGSSSSPVVFSAGSLASTLYPEIAGETGNQFHVIDIDLTQHDKLGLVGTFASWDWHRGFGWLPAELNKGLPARGGFGYRVNTNVVADSVMALLSESPERFLSGEELYGSLPELRYLTPLDLRTLVTSLEGLSAIMTIRDDGQIDEVALA